MYRSVKQFFVLLIAAMTMQLCPNDTQATTVTELLDAMRQRQLSIQDYDFVVSRSFFIEPLEDHEIDLIVKKQYEEFSSSLESTPEQMEQIALMTEFSRLSLERSRESGAILQIKGIGGQIQSSAICMTGDPLTRQLVDILNTPPEKRDNPDLYILAKPKMEFAHHIVFFPDFAVRGNPSSNREGVGDELFAFPPHSVVSIEDGFPELDRSSNFPFLHEEPLRYATPDNTTIVSENEDEIELLVTTDTPLNFSFTLFCNREGRVHRVIKKAGEDVWHDAEYLHFVEMKPEGIEIPQAGRIWSPARGLNSAHPSQERTKISTILHSKINSGLTLDDLVIEASEGTTITERRTGREYATITTTRPLRLGANLPDDINELNRDDE